MRSTFSLLLLCAAIAQSGCATYLSRSFSRLSLDDRLKIEIGQGCVPIVMGGAAIAPVMKAISFAPISMAGDKPDKHVYRSVRGAAETLTFGDRTGFCRINFEAQTRETAYRALDTIFQNEFGAYYTDFAIRKTLTQMDPDEILFCLRGKLIYFGPDQDKGTGFAVDMRPSDNCSTG